MTTCVYVLGLFYTRLVYVIIYFTYNVSVNEIVNFFYYDVPFNIICKRNNSLQDQSGSFTPLNLFLSVINVNYIDRYTFQSYLRVYLLILIIVK